MNLPRFDGHPRSHESAVGVVHGQRETAGVHEGVQGPDGAAGTGQRQVHRRDRPRAGPRRERAPKLGQAGGGGCGPGPTWGVDDRGARGVHPAAPRSPDPADGARHPFPVAPNVLARRFEQPVPDAAWVTDITYIPTGEGWLYLAVILDLYSRFVVGWAMSDRITRELALDALDMALVRRRPFQGLLHHSDRGSQYASGDYQNVLAAAGMVCSMSRRGNCVDNAVAER